ncbi:MAG: family 78 glycoside hydrolase catalytic domain [Flexilinea sp.]|nr:family 78 glycoside hydrolase catalytic domain [Flexilinea sp.]
MKAANVKVEYLRAPIGIDITEPRFDWTCEGGKKQTAYKIVCRDGSEVMWDSGKVNSASMSHIPYKGKPLQSRQHIDFDITLWDENDSVGEAITSSFEMGLLTPADFKASWICGDYHPQRNTRYPVDCFQKAFRLKDGIDKARLYMTACGIYNAYLNGQRISGSYFMPGTTDYDKRLYYQTYDVTELLKAENCLEVYLGDGWYRGSLGAFSVTNVFGRQTKLLLQLEITYGNGQTETICSDGSFSWSNDGPVRFNDMKDGEVYDASLKPSFRGKAVIVSEDKNLCAANTEPVRRHEVFDGKQTEYNIYDFGQNLAGILSFDVKGRKGQKLRIVLGERVVDGKVDLSSIQEKRPAGELSKLQTIMVSTYMWKPKKDNYVLTPKQEVVFYCSGGDDHYEMNFSVAGFRYAQFFCQDEIELRNVKAIAVYSDLDVTGKFECSDPDINRLYLNTLWAMKSNSLDLPTDCPTRERLGWTGDAQVFFETAAYLMDIRAFYRKYIIDMKDNQKKDGKVSAAVPRCGADIMLDNTGTSVGWADAAILIPWRFYKAFNDIRILQDNYELMRKLGMFMIKNAGFKNKKDNTKTAACRYVYEKGVHLGEWLEPKEFQETIKPGKMTVRTEEATAYMHYSMACLKETAELLGKSEDAELFGEYSNGSKQAYNDLFLKTIPDTDRQAKIVRPLALGLADGETKKGLENRLVQAAVNKDYCVMTGFLSTPFVLDVLTDAGRSDIAYKMLENRKSPSWLYEVSQGATTVWEDWEGTVSLNHYSPGAVTAWFFNTIGGIRVSGENHFDIRPIPGGTLNHAAVEYQSIYGKVRVRWGKQADGIDYEIEVPSNTSADVIINGVRSVLDSGIYHFREE